MNVEKPPQRETNNSGYIVDSRRPVLSFRWQAEGAHRATAHAHPRGQIIYVTSGAYWVVTALGSWIVPSHQAVWIPSHLHHEVFSNDSIKALMLFVDETYVGALPQQCVVVGASPLLCNLFERVVDNGNEYPPDGREARLIQVLLDELNTMTPTSLHLPMAGDKRVKRIMLTLLENPCDERTLDEFATVACASARTLARLFIKETGMTFGDWRKQLRLLHAIDRLGHGQSITRIALESGYGSASAFIAMFRRSLGVPPGRYFQS